MPTLYFRIPIAYVFIFCSTVTNYHKNEFSHSSGSQKSENSFTGLKSGIRKVVLPPEVQRENPFLASLSFR
jgi:hypothetical protein